MPDASVSMRLWMDATYAVYGWWMYGMGVWNEMQVRGRHYGNWLDVEEATTDYSIQQSSRVYRV